jgi:type II secretory pathway pseudopilin PulG
MCDPITIAGLAATVGGSYMQNKANKQVENKRRENVGAEYARQQALSDSANSQFKESLNSQTSDNQKEKLSDTQQKLGDIYKQVVSSGDGSYLPSQDSSPAIVRQVFDSKAEDAKNFGNQQATALGNIGGYGDVALSNALGFTRSGENINNLANSMQRSSNILPLELNAANYVGDSSRKWGDALTGAGQIMSLAGIAGMGPSWGTLKNSLGFGSNLGSTTQALTGGFHPKYGFQSAQVPLI